MDWKKFKPSEEKTPEEVVAESIQGFGEATGSLVDMQLVRKSELEKITSPLRKNFEYDLIIYSRYISGYSFKVLEFGFNADLYPALVLIDQGINNELNTSIFYNGKASTIDTQEEFIRLLGLVFETEKFKTVIEGLMKIASKEINW